MSISVRKNMTKTEVPSVAQWLGWFLFKRKNIESNFPQFSHSDVVVDVVLVVVDCSILILVRVKKKKLQFIILSSLGVISAIHSAMMMMKPTMSLLNYSSILRTQWRRQPQFELLLLLLRIISAIALRTLTLKYIWGLIVLRWTMGIQS